MSTSRHLVIASTLLGVMALAAAPIGRAAPPASTPVPATAPAAATTPAKAKTRTPQQQRMADCSHQAKADGKKGPERKAFMSSCLKGKTAAVATTPAAPKAKAKVPSTGGSQR